MSGLLAGFGIGISLLLAAIILTLLGGAEAEPLTQILRSVEILRLFVSQGVSPGEFGYFLVWTTRGNALGGSCSPC